MERKIQLLLVYSSFLLLFTLSILVKCLEIAANSNYFIIFARPRTHFLCVSRFTHLFFRNACDVGFPRCLPWYTKVIFDVSDKRCRHNIHADLSFVLAYLLFLVTYYVQYVYLLSQLEFIHLQPQASNIFNFLWWGGCFCNLFSQSTKETKWSTWDLWLLSWHD